jgi:putative ABC transport system permease protein
MNLIALKMLVGDKLKYLSLVAGLAFAALLVTQQSSIFTGYALRVASWVRDTDHAADLWVMDPQAEFTEANKPMLDTALSRVRGVEGVAWAMPIYKGYLKARLPDGTLVTVRLVGIDDATLIGAPPQMVDGRLEDLRRDRAVFMNADEATKNLLLKRLATPRPLKVGDSFSINDHEVTVVGSYRCTPEFFWEPVFYTTYSRALSIAPAERKVLSFVLVKVKDGLSHDAVARRIADVTGLKVMTGKQFAWATTDYILQKTGILINFGMTIGLGFIIGALIAGQTLFTFILVNLRHFAAIKAMGATIAAIVRMVFLQVAVAGVIGYGIGVGAACATGALFGKYGLAFEMPWQIPVIGAVAIFACCLGAAMFSLSRVLRLEPGIVFKA